MATNQRSGDLCLRPSRLDATPSSINVVPLDIFFIGKNHPIDYSPNFHKGLKKAYHDTMGGLHLNLIDGPSELDEKPKNMSFGCLLDYLQDQRKRTMKSLPDIVQGASIVCRRGALNKLLNAPYSERSSFRFAVKKFQGLYFIKELSTPFSERQSANSTEAQLYLSKFKNFVIHPFDDPNYSQPDAEVVSTWEQMQQTFTCTFSSNRSAQSIKIFYGSEIDALDKDGNVVEIKLQKTDFGTTLSSDDKLRKWFYQSQLVGAESIILGLRNNEVLTKVNRVGINNFLQLFHPRNQWSPSCSYSAVTKVMASILERYENDVQANEFLVVELLPNYPNIQYQVHGDNVLTILPDKFKEAFQEPHKKQEYKKSGYLLVSTDGWMDDVILKSF